MSVKRLTLRSLTVSNGALPPATISFNARLNLIIGASNTGKTFIFEAVDFMLGAKDGLRRIPESDGYNQVSLSIDPSDGPQFTLRRAFNGGRFELVEFANGRDEPATQTKRLSAKHSSEPRSSLSAYLLQLVGIGNRQVRKNVQGKKKALSFRHVAHLLLVDEQTIIQTSSPVLSKHVTEHTAEANVFAYFLSGIDDSAIIPQESNENRTARLTAEAGLLETLIEERRTDLSKVSTHPEGLAQQANRLEEAINIATTVVVHTQGQIKELEEQRATLVSERAIRSSRLMFLLEQLKRLRLLDQYYRTDRARLEAVIEASQVFHDLPEGICLFCRQAYPEDVGFGPPHAEFEEACTKEIHKIDALQRDLVIAIADFSQEEQEHQTFLETLAQRLQEINDQLRMVLLPSTGTAQSDLQSLLNARATVAEGVAIQATIRSLEARLANTRQVQTERAPNVTFESRVTTSTTSEFCKVVEDILGEWGYPELGTVAFDTANCDLVIGGKDRANTGKGYRAITHAAFTIGLMKYCRQKGYPHPGFVMLDTPVNPYKGPTPATPEDRLTDSVKNAFFKYLMDDRSGDQFIIIENEQPSSDIDGQVTRYDFSRNPDVGRFGFFPPRPTQTS